MGLQDMATILDQEGQHLRVFQGLVLVMARLVIGLKSDLGMSQFLKLHQHLVLAFLDLLRCFRIMGMMAILVSQLGSARVSHKVRALRVWNDYRKIIHQSREYPQYGIIQLIYIIFLLLWHLHIEVVNLVPQLIIHMFSLYLDLHRFVLSLVHQVCYSDSTMIGALLFPPFTFFI